MFRHPALYVKGEHLNLTVLETTLTDENIDELKEMTAVIYEIEPILNSYEFAYSAYLDLEKAISELECSINLKTELYDVDATSRRTRNVTKCMLQYQCLARTFLDHTKVCLTRNYGKKSAHLNTYLKGTHNAFDAGFGYGFLYKLRNYAQHIDIPISNYHVNCSDVETDKMITDVKISVSRDRLIENYDEWSKVLPGLQEQPADIELLPLIRDDMRNMTAIFKCAMNENHSRLMNFFGYMITFRRVFFKGMQEGILALAEGLDPKQANLQFLPNDQAQRLYEALNRDRPFFV